MFEVKFLRHNKEKHNSNVSQEYSFKKTFNTVTELMQYLDKAPRLSISVVDYSGLSHSEWYAFCQKRHQKLWNDRLKYKKEHPEISWIDQYLTPEHKKKEFLGLLKGGRFDPTHNLPKNYYKKHDL